ncbi:MAG: cytochrome P450 [Cephaloticoccus sp.]|nr:cytochrome P450 [Cephaloticoccus sp.]MCF7760291.1 cytochrome P450 [Cephaloticoccus sp.]
MKLDDVISTPAFAADPFPAYRELQEKYPVQWSDSWNCWVVTRYDDVRTCLQDAKRFSNVGRITGLFHRLFDPAQLAQLKPLIDHYSHGLINIDPPGHTRIRRLLHEVFRPSTIIRYRDFVQAFVNEALVKSLPTGKLTVVRDLAHPLPVHVIARLFGVPVADVPLFTAWSAGIVAFMQSPTPTLEVCLHSQQALLDLRAYLRRGILERQTTPLDDVLSLMVHARSEGDALTEDEILGTAVTILLGGHETTTRLLTTTLLELARHPEQQESLRRNPYLMETAVEEFLRFAGPFHRDQRVAAIDTEIGGQHVHQGDFILLLLAAANRDPRHFPDPDKFDLARTPNRHVAFGFGPHICLGAPLARLEMGIAVGSILQATKSFKVASDQIDWEFGFLRGPRELELELRN